MNKKIDKLIKDNPDLADYILGLNTQIEALTFTLSKLNRHIFGTSSEKSNHQQDEEERNLFNLNEAEANQNLNAVEPTID